jgi:anaerobic selenocysteine-containing dehydrogenase
MTSSHRSSLCRICNKGCPVVLEIAGGRVLSVRGDRNNVLFGGYTCVKGRALPSFLSDPSRLLHSQARGEAGFQPILVERAMDEISDRLQRILAEYGPRSVATYYGTQLQNVPANPLMRAFMRAVGSPMSFAASSVDKPGRPIAWAMLGRWQAPPQGFADAQVALMIGINPFVNGLGGIPSGHPGRWLSERLDAGMELIVIDPRRSDIAKRATIFLQPEPGHDIAILAAMLRVIISEGRHDRAFVREDVRNLSQLERAVEPFEPSRVAAAAGLDEADLVRAARAFAAASRGYVVAGTGPHMANHGTLLEYLALCLDTIRGHWLRAGDIVQNAGVLGAPTVPRAQAADPGHAHGFGERSRVRGLGMSAAGMPSATLAEEILLDGPGRVRALISAGGNPVAALPDQQQTVRALESLELLVQVDPWMSETAKLAHYVIAPRMSPEMIGTTFKIETACRGYATGYGFPSDYAQYCDAAVYPPAGSEVIEDWELFYGLAQRLGLPLSITTEGGEQVALDMSRRPDPESLVTLLSKGSRVPLQEVRRHPGGAFFPASPPVVVQPKQPGWTGRLDVGNADMMAELTRRVTVTIDMPVDYPFRLLNRRMAHVVNSSYNARVIGGHPGFNPAFLNPADLTELGLEVGDIVHITSAHGAIAAVVAEDGGLRRRTVSISFGFGGRSTDDRLVRSIGSSVARLLSTSDNPDPYSGQPLMSNVPVKIGKALSREVNRSADT